MDGPCLAIDVSVRHRPPPNVDFAFVRHSPKLFAMEKARENGILVIAASIIAVIRLRGEPIKPIPKVSATIADSVQLARMVLDEVQGEKVTIYRTAEKQLRAAARERT